MVGVVVLVPAYEPDGTLVRLVASLRTAAPGVPVVVVDDGSGPAFGSVFAGVRALGASVLTSAENRGKGHALKTGLAHVERAHPGDDVVCADSDGQHGVADILHVAARVPAAADAMVLGRRGFTDGVPLRSRLGNAISAPLVRLASGLRLRDSQTGLRAYPAAMLGWLQTIPGDRYEYELNVLLAARAAGWRVEEVDVATIYLDGNASSHFRPLVDSARIYAQLLRFCLSSLVAFAVDTVALLALYALTGHLLLSVVGARLTSATANFVTNRHLVFQHGPRRRVGAAAARYAALVVGLLAVNYLMLRELTGLGIELLPAKVLTESTLFAASYLVQRRVVYSAGREVAAASAARPGEPRPAQTTTTLVPTDANP